MKTVLRKNLKAGHTFYIITSDNQIEFVNVIKRKSPTRMAMRGIDGPLRAELVGSILGCTMYPSRRAAKRAMWLQAV